MVVGVFFVVVSILLYFKTSCVCVCVCVREIYLRSSKTAWSRE